ncbi:dimethylhistidine N-methyltransferase [Pedobacter sp. AK017]|uniref:L-histidine N(alpha)-methyltransferase n=1 Tax=Pedobacter sp. AK017 TaxID=2723073 RepID=UPI00161A444B|nr:L-histidine N(alpha)-methyltransferase [Pedobacter sp. AK017]MBB5438099.1 dimethylhistidine N-methyltransferase [Pedobacter sp. AK017]
MDTTIKLIPGTANFLEDILTGLKARPKFLHSKYFYDRQGDAIFQQIMAMKEYYLTDSEMDILANQSKEIAKMIAEKNSPFDLLELGAGDATKSIHLLKELTALELEFSYLPVDISANVITNLENCLPLQLPGLDIKGLNGDYLDMLKKGTTFSDRRKVVLFMGANIGNMNMEDTLNFCNKLRESLSENDILLIGFDLKKNPRQILSAYSDAGGITRDFNLNLLKRINRELGGDFDLKNFEHYASYDPESGACKSFLVSLTDQTVHIGDDTIQFLENEYIFMEISQKYALEDIEMLAIKSGFRCKQHFFDKNMYFVDSIWLVD